MVQTFAHHGDVLPLLKFIRRNHPLILGRISNPRDRPYHDFRDADPRTLRYAH